MGAESADDRCSLADSIGRSLGHSSADHFQSDSIWTCIDMVIEKHFDVLIECMKNRVAGRSKEAVIAIGRCLNRRRWCRGQCAALCIDISANSCSFELFQRNEVVEMSGRCILNVRSIGPSVDRICYFDVRLTPTGYNDCTRTKLLFDQPLHSW